MSQKPIAVLGGGSGAHMMAVDLTDRGYPVHMGEHPRLEESFKPTLTKGAIEAVGIGPVGVFPIKQVSTDLARIIEGVEWINVAMSANGHEFFFKDLAPHLKPGQKVVIWAGDFGSLRLRKMLADQGRDKGVTIIEANTLPYGTRLMEPGKICLLLVAGRVMVAALPGSQTGQAMEELKAIFPQVFAGKNVLEVAFNNPNPIVHPPGSLLNTGRIEFSGGDFYMYHEGITESVAKVIREVYEESRRVARALDFDMIQYKDGDFKTKCSIMGVEFEGPFDPCGVIGSILGPRSLKDRYVSEDLPFGLVPRSQLGKLVGVPTPVIDGLISLGCAACEENFWESGRTLESLGLAGLGKDEVIKLIEG
ncbi:MAG: NAD/NADP octopine/nopaline dehydrogenase family protein [Deltaproteobacteria bacterium]|nr:NAD/NADP octopine/nopaline dehydrogenase family protein [Deltaproteobacteria bacterium]